MSIVIESASASVSELAEEVLSESAVARSSLAASNSKVSESPGGSSKQGGPVAGMVQLIGVVNLFQQIQQER